SFPRGRSATRRRSRGWGPAVGGEQSGRSSRRTSRAGDPPSEASNPEDRVAGRRGLGTRRPRRAIRRDRAGKAGARSATSLAREPETRANLRHAPRRNRRGRRRPAPRVPGVGAQASRRSNEGYSDVDGGGAGAGKLDGSGGGR